MQNKIVLRKKNYFIGIKNNNIDVQLACKKELIVISHVKLTNI